MEFTEPEQAGNAVEQSVVALRGVAHATHPRHVDGFVVADVYRLTAALAEATAAVGQVCGQLGGVLAHRVATSELRQDDGGDPAAAIEDARSGFEAAVKTAESLAALLLAVQNAIAGTGETQASITTREQANDLEQR